MYIIWNYEQEGKALLHYCDPLSDLPIAQERKGEAEADGANGATLRLRPSAPQLQLCAVIAFEIMICLPSRSLGAKISLALNMILKVGLTYLIMKKIKYVN